MCGAAAGLFLLAVHRAYGQTNESTAAALTPQSVVQSFTAWNAVALLVGGVIWHFILKVAPWSKANGGLFRGVCDFFWIKGWVKPAATSSVPAPGASLAALEPRRMPDIRPAPPNS